MTIFIQQICSMSYIKPYPITPLRIHRLRTEQQPTNDKSNLTDSQVISTAREYVGAGSYFDLSISKNKVSQKTGYLNRRKREERQSSSQKKGNTKVYIFKNLQEFESQLKTQKGRLDRVQVNLHSFGIATYRGTKKAINSHQLGAHIGNLTAFTLIEAYDGLFAASQLKKHYHNELLLNANSLKMKQREEPFQATEAAIRKAVQNSVKYLKKVQQQRGDNSGASFLSLVANNGIVFVANCGSSETLCMTHQGRMLKLAKAHTTLNEEEVERIVKEGGQLYQTLINIPYKRQMKLAGPLRVHPDGLMLTRTMGKSLSPSKQKKVSTISGTTTIPKGILSLPEYHYIPSSEVRWVVILSSKIAQTLPSTRVLDIIEQQLSKRSANYSEEEASQHACKRIILEGVQSGVSESVSVVLILGGISEPVVKQKVKQAEQPGIKITPVFKEQKLVRQPRSLRYIGRRPNFAEIMSEQE